MPESSTSGLHRRATLVAWLVLLVSLVVVAVNALSYRSLEQQIFADHRAQYRAGADAAALAIEQEIEHVERAAEALAAAIGDGSLAREGYEDALASMLRQSPLFYGGAIAFAPYEYDPQRRLYAPYYSKKDGALAFAYVEDAYDYTGQGREWYVQAMASGSRWSKPYFDQSLGDILMTTYSAVVYRPGEDGPAVPVAVVTIDLAIDAIGELVSAISLGGVGYAEIVTDEGTYLYSPDKSRVLNRQSLLTDGRWARDAGFRRLGDLVASGDAGLAPVVDPSTNKAHLVGVVPIAGSSWRLVGNYAAEDLDPKSAGLRHRLMFIILGLVVAACVIALRWQWVTPRNAVISWPTAALVSLVLLVGIYEIWRVAMTYDSVDDRRRVPLVSEQQVRAEVRTYTELAREHLADTPLPVPVGLYVESMRFISASDIEVVGSVWQKLDADNRTRVKPGLIFPGAARVRFGEPFVIDEEGRELVRWQFSGEWRFRHHYARYPLVKGVFSIGVLPVNTANNVMLVPDLNSYAYLAPASLPALGPDVFLLGWLVQGSYYELVPWRHNSTFGRPETVRTEKLPELLFSVEMERAFIPAIISSLTPLVIALLICFVTLLISTSDKERLEVLRTGVGFDIGISTSIFFVVVLSHIGLRERIVSEQIFYLEYFYMLMYANLIWKCCHSILSSSRSRMLDKLTFGVSAKKGFFPVNLLIIFCFTWLAFYS